MMQSYTKFYGRYAEQTWQETPDNWCHCPSCGRKTLEFLVDVETKEVVGCTECTVTEISHDERYMVDAGDEVYLQCPRCEQLCDTLYACYKSPEWVDGCDQCLEWTDAYGEED